MITQETMTITESILMTYLVDMSAWLIGQKNINHNIAQLTKEEIVTILKNDYDHLKTKRVTEYSEELWTTITTLEELSEQQFQDLKLNILSWEPTMKNSN
ncbi:hypothetical protein DIY07_09545 [Streptococcus iniae]|uniref:Uncharacterized protein n=1 Tax=Streptococcus iniae TaxID=1346 RepID=A0A3L8G481_STRIN|nr:hypothetical protein [Streptococcus iniae]RLU51744.1 hypothetical protein DIY09_09440 [Streptococcus iniae]RLU54867.1 hypothetical protein DIY07_09545 [Streptococcus iniae]